MGLGLLGEIALQLISVASPAKRLLLLREHFRLDAGLLEDIAERALGHVAGMVGDGGVAVGDWVMPDLMAPWRWNSIPSAFSRRVMSR